VVLDCWRILPREKFEGLVDHLMLGHGATSTDHARPRRAQVLAAEAD
jgi:hypothetical protein